MTIFDPATRPGRLLRGLRRALLVALIGYLALLANLYVRQESLLFHPEPLPADFSFAGRYAPDQNFEEIRIPVDGAVLDALLFRQPASRGLVFYLHGNTGNLTSWTSRVDFYRRLGFDLFMLDYRGFGKSSGHIDGEAQLHADVRAAWNRIAPAYAGKPVAILGRSLGTGLATRLARDVKPELLVLVSPYTSLLSIAREHYPPVPRALFKYPLESDRLIAEVTSPVLILHGRDDVLIPIAHAEALVAASGGRAKLLTVDGAGHDNIHDFAAYRDTLARRLTELGASPLKADRP